MQGTKSIKVHKKKLKSLKMDAVSESRQGALAAANYTLATTNYTIAIAKANFATAMNLMINWKLE